MRHGRRNGRLGLVQEHRRALLRNLARHLITRQQIVTTHARAKEASRFVDQLVTIAKEKTLHARRHLIQKLGSGSEAFARRLIDSIAPKFSDRNGGYTRVLHYKNRPGDGASLSLLAFSIPVVEVEEKKPKKKKEPKPVVKEVKEKKHKEEAEKPKHPARIEEEAKKEEAKKETPKKGGFLSSLRRFLKGEDDKK
ncbi:MAG: 50S ribosomal protein L17 [Candidatus Omnitrophica bacterium]|nr:50S ribosomal protein L17 [Candidatus Omnitrophota bacterium]